MGLFKKGLHVYGFVSAVALCASLSPAHAQVGEATRSADPTRAAQDILTAPDVPDVQPRVPVQNRQVLKAPQGAEDIKLTLNSLIIEGIGIYEEADVAPLYQDKIGTEVTLAEIYATANALTRKYRNDGYILTQVVVPPQKIEGGVVKLRVVEGFVDKIIIEGVASEKEKHQIWKYADNLRTNGILDAREMERYLLLIRDLPGVSARSVLSKSETTPGASDLTLVITRDRFEGRASVDNYGSRFLGAYRANVTGSFNSPFGFNERITTQFSMAGDNERPDELLFGSAVYEQVLSRFGSKLVLQGFYSHSEPGFTLQPFDVEGDSLFLSVGFTHPFIRSRSVNFTGRGSFDWRNVESEDSLTPEATKDRIRSVRVGANLQFIDTLLGGRAGVNLIDFQASQGVPFFGASSNGADNLTRARGNPHYTKAELEIQRLQRVIPDVNLLLAARGQLASTALLSSEEFGVGGIRYGRGYDPSEIIADDGYATKVELQWNEPKRIKYLHDYQLFTFWDFGRVFDKDATTSDAARESISSVGFGVRGEITEKLNLDLGIAYPLTRNVDTHGDRDPRYYFSISHEL